MDAPGDLWSSLYFVPVFGVFALAGAVYYLSFRGKEDDHQSMRIYLNVLSGDDEKNRKAAKRLRKFGPPAASNAATSNSKRLTTSGSAGVDAEADNSGKQVDSDSEKRAGLVAGTPTINNALPESLSTRKPTQSSSAVLSKKTDLPAASHSSSSAVVGPGQQQLEYSLSSSQVTPTSQVPEVVTDDAGEHGVTALLDGNNTSPESSAATGWHKAISRKDKKHSMVGLENSKTADDATNHSTTSEESRLSFRNSNSSRNSSPYRSHHNHAPPPPAPVVYEARKFSSRGKTLAKPAHLLQQQQHQRPDHLKLEPTSASTGNSAGGRRTGGNGNFPQPPPTRPTILLSRPEAATQQHRHAAAVMPGSSLSFRCSTTTSSNSSAIPTGSSRGYTASDHPRIASSVLPPGQSDMCIQTEANEDYPSPLEGLRQVDAGKPRFVICHDFAMQVDLDVPENSSESESELRFEDGDKILYSSGASLSSGEGSSRVTPVLEDDMFSREFSMTSEKSQGVHQRNQAYGTRIYSRQSAQQQNFPSRYGDNMSNNSRNSDGKRGGGGGVGDTAAYYAGHNDLRNTCRVEKGSSDWIDNSSRRGPTPVNGRWRN